MFLPTIGASRDKTTVLISSRIGGIDKKNSSSSETDNLYLLEHDTEDSSPLESFFQLAYEIKSDLKRVSIAFSELLKEQRKCLRPTFADSHSQINTVESLTSNINQNLAKIYQKISFFDISNEEFPDRAQVLHNIKINLLDQYNKFSASFKAELQSFQASYKNSISVMKQEDDDVVDYKTFQLGDSPVSVQQHVSYEENQQIEELARRSEEVREIFMDLAGLIAEQGTLVDRIDYNINVSLENAESAHKSIEKAAKHQKKSRMWMYALILLVLVVILFIFALTK